MHWFYWDTTVSVAKEKGPNYDLFLFLFRHMRLTPKKTTFLIVDYIDYLIHVRLDIVIFLIFMRLPSASRLYYYKLTHDTCFFVYVCWFPIFYDRFCRDSLKIKKAPQRILQSEPPLTDTKPDRYIMIVGKTFELAQQKYQNRFVFRCVSRCLSPVAQRINSLAGVYWHPLNATQPLTTVNWFN